ncbi:hypothetical protein HN018_25810 (plasmid) [Lichenicola cladoniae]|uniref:Uncharacterized protein n=1 Tax=Lichenicola cladoniae TaxID=1484109 RepID=A0A6M8HZH0_9PROT|nr:hypothetical protein [Lichenicola cladoniae]NPD70023.1 hypothetical protein [Acetobacteraceae bacterium]QKE93555.1 hypothetical protein HN018_25810 [Lichenicola cladoniae]
MQISEITDPSKTELQAQGDVRHPRKLGTIPVTVRLDPPRYDRLKRLVQRYTTTGQHIIQTALDRSMVTLERERMPKVDIAGQSMLFEPAVDGQASVPRKPRQDSFAFVRPEPTVALTYRASVPMHRWLHQAAAERDITIQELINDALKAARGAQ